MNPNFFPVGLFLFFSVVLVEILPGEEQFLNQTTCLVFSLPAHCSEISWRVRLEFLFQRSSVQVSDGGGETEAERDGRTDGWSVIFRD